MQAPDTLYRYVDLCDAYSWYEGQHSNLPQYQIQQWFHNDTL